MTGLFCYSGVTDDDTDIMPTGSIMAEKTITPLSHTMNYFFEVLEYEFRRAVRYRNEMTLIFIKLCRLDEIVKICGQLTADRILSEIESIIRTNIRFTDRGFIYGKDEYMIILPQTSRNNAGIMISKLQRLIENYHFPSEKGLSYNLSPKFGIASFPFRKDSTEGPQKNRGKTNKNTIVS